MSTTADSAIGNAADAVAPDAPDGSSDTLGTDKTMAYYIPHAARWPIVGSVGLFIWFYGFATWLNGGTLGREIFILGTVIVVVMMFGWFGTVIRESESGTYSGQVDGSFRMCMMWFIFSEVMFFAAFFGALFYARQFSGPWLGGEGGGGADMTNAVLYPGLRLRLAERRPVARIGGDFEQMGWFGLPLINTLLLLTSGLTCTLAHHAIRHGDRKKIRVLARSRRSRSVSSSSVCRPTSTSTPTTELNLKMSSGIYGSTFFMLTGFHGFHVTMGAIILLVVMLRGMRSPLLGEQPLRVRGGGVVLALRRRGLARAVHLRLPDLTDRRARGALALAKTGLVRRRESSLPNRWNVEPVPSGVVVPAADRNRPDDASLFVARRRRLRDARSLCGAAGDGSGSRVAGRTIVSVPDADQPSRARRSRAVGVASELPRRALAGLTVDDGGCPAGGCARTLPVRRGSVVRCGGATTAAGCGLGRRSCSPLRRGRRAARPARPDSGLGFSSMTPVAPAIMTTTIARIDNPMRTLKALTVRFVWPLSLTRKNSPENRLTTTKPRSRRTMTLTSSIREAYHRGVLRRVAAPLAVDTLPSGHACAVRLGSRRFAPRWWATTLYLVVALAMLALGRWQLARADEKIALLESAERARAAPAVALERVDDVERAADAHRRVLLAGRWEDERQLLWDNRAHAGRAGYEVITPFRLDGGRLALVNRGWIAPGPTRDVLPDVSLPDAPRPGDVVLEGLCHVRRRGSRAGTRSRRAGPGLACCSTSTTPRSRRRSVSRSSPPSYKRRSPRRTARSPRRGAARRPARVRDGGRGRVRARCRTVRNRDVRRGGERVGGRGGKRARRGGPPDTELAPGGVRPREALRLRLPVVRHGGRPDGDLRRRQPVPERER